ncbi:uncharacterized protein LOC110893362 [Helianthus annuus]|uniref:uncharacterized protein LOC110893362 n=1 Tax=Helianthus annuus TaxID=4232 RepID=UPI000B8F68F0|nr:uncharacterized protein LOC110893362 [Helianthus annuus]
MVFPLCADLYTIEFQKRGLPHCHTLLWVSDAYSIRNAEQVDHYISAELPDHLLKPVLHRIVMDYMLHGPCGLARMGSPCMKDGVCKKNFPKPYEDFTRFDNAGYVHYKRSSTSAPFLKNGVPLDNGYVVPYNANLLMHFEAHINVEYYGWTMLIKYLFKYISKGADRIQFALTRDRQTGEPADIPEVINEIKNYTDGRFICPHEAVWRIFSFPIHHKNPPVQVLAVHLEGKQNLTFKQSQWLSDITSNSNIGKTTLTKWFVNNTNEISNENNSGLSGVNLRYIDYLSMYRWDMSSKKLMRRRSKREPTIGRLTYVHPTCGELFYLRLLLNFQRGCCSFADVRTISGTVMPTFREACERLGLIGDDKEWATTIEGAAEWATAAELRSLFTCILLHCDVSNPRRLWETNWKCMSDDINRSIGLAITTHSAVIADQDLQQYVLRKLETLLNTNSTSRSLVDYGLPMPDASVVSGLGNSLLLEEKSYDRDALRIEHMSLHKGLRPGQLAVYNAVMSSFENGTQCLLFVYGHGGTGKTYLWKTIIARLRSRGEVVLAVAASGIASLLLPSGRTAHSRFKIPLELTEESICYIKKKSNLCNLLLQTTLIIWDEAPMSDRRCLESLDKTLKDLTSNTSQYFGGKISFTRRRLQANITSKT